MGNNFPDMPSDLEMERRVLGSLMQAKEFNEDINDWLKHLSAPMFYSPANRIIYEAILAASKDNNPDMIAVSGHLKGTGKLKSVGGEAYLIGLVNCIPDVANVPYYASVLKNRAARRGIIKMAHKASHDALLDTVDPNDLAKQLEVELQNIGKASGNGIIDTESIMPALKQRRADIASGARRSIPSGIPAIDDMLPGGGFPIGYPVVIKGKEGAGKTALMLQALDSMVDMGNKVLLVSMEMRREDVWPRVIVGRIYRRGLVLSDFDYSCLWNTGDWIAKNPDAKAFEDNTAGWYIDDRDTMTPDAIIGTINRHIRDFGVTAVAIDHLNLTSHSFGHTQQDKELFCEQLRGLAKEKRIVLIQLLQVQVKDGTVYYYKTATQAAAVVVSVDTKKQSGETIIEIEKNRFGPWGKRTCRFIGGVQTFERTGGAGYHVPKSIDLDGSAKGGHNQVQRPRDSRNAEDDREPGTGSQETEINLDEDVDFF